MNQLKYTGSLLLIFAFTLMIVNKCVFIGSGPSTLPFCYEMEDDMESKGNKSEIKKETDKLCKPDYFSVEASKTTLNYLHRTLNIDFEEGHPSQPDLPPEV